MLLKFFEGKRCQAHNKPCMAIKLAEKTSFQDKIQCFQCFSDKKQQKQYRSLYIEKICNIIGYMDTMKQNLILNRYSSYFRILKEFQEEMNILKEQFESIIVQINSTFTSFEQQFKKSFTRTDVQDNEMNNILEVVITQNNNNYHQFILNQQVQLIKNNQHKVMQNQKLLNGCEQQIIQLKNILDQISQLKLQINELQQIDNNQIFIQGQMNANQSHQYSQVNEISLNKTISSLALNKNNQILAIGSRESILMYEFIKGQVEHLQKLDAPGWNVSNLKFCNNNDTLISECQKGAINIWIKIQQSMKWECQLQFQAHEYSIICILINKNDDELISLGYDSTIAIWDIKGSKKQFLKEKENNFYQINYNSDESLLISKSTNNLIIYQKNYESQQFNLKQNIKAKDGYRACFINDQLIACESQESIALYKLNEQEQIFQLVSLIVNQFIEKECFQNFNQELIFNKNSQILLGKQEQFIYCMKINFKDYSLESCQQIMKTNEFLCCTITDDGKQIIVGDDVSKKLIIFELQQSK